MDEPDSCAGESSGLLAAVSVIFRALGRGVLCLDGNLRVLHASEGVDQRLSPEALARVAGMPVAEVLGDELFGPGGPLLRALEEGQRREGWGTTLRIPGEEPKPVSVTVAPIDSAAVPGCDPRVSYLVVVRPAEEGEAESGPATRLFSGLVARSAVMLRLFALIEQLRESDATVLITGESGTGKELVARALHFTSPRSRGPFVAVNCGALPAELLESELFGHVRGAFTGAVRDRLGRFELAAGGTLFLDEVGDLPLPLQVKLLRVLQERSFERVGESRSRKANVRIVAATHQDLRRAVAEGRFREDLFYRLRVVPLEVPPLRERREDIEPLARHLLARINARQGRSQRLDPGLVRRLVSYSWPGNVRELENALEYAVAVGPGQTLHATDLPFELQGAAAESLLPVPIAAASPRSAAESAERERFRSVLAEHRWKREEAARALGMSRTTLWRKMRELGLGS